VRTVPVWLFPQPNYVGQSIKIVKGGGAEDLSTLPGNWLNKIRSIRFS
jgi:hypothetical protein